MKALRKSKQLQGIYVINPKHPLYDSNNCFYIHYHTNAGFMVKYCGEWFTVKQDDCYPMYEIGIIETVK